MNVTVIGGTGHVGTYLIPRLVELGHTVSCISRNNRKPYAAHAAWKSVRMVGVDREKAEADGSFGGIILAETPDVVIDMICFTAKSGRILVKALAGQVQQLLVCGTIWIHGASVSVPTRESAALDAFGEYGVNKLELTRYLLDESRRTGFPVSVIHPGHIVGPGWYPVNPLGNWNPLVFSRLARGEEVAYPTLGMETVHHVHADDIAQLFLRAMERWSVARGEDFHCVSEAAVTLRGFAEVAAGWFGRKARLVFRAPDEVWTEGLTEDDVKSTWDHVSRSPNSSIQKAQSLLGYAPRYSSLDAVYESVQWLLAQGMIAV